ncbi:MAG: DUF386 domain-containing protein [Ignavibacteria bacterium]|jgi:YhcH/YjgK/YiaL family protein|nr:DUF386 domain-containing protein [Ignavibacteria bacterium]MCU7504295.1 DUF386 domain-containing protein [Ignavibacteria bacterium]MCU7516140.1 DUF386 domain-containing protein [Ignavibacteria bacterium]
MVFDSLINFKNYINLHPQFRDVYNFLLNNNTKDIPFGKHKVNTLGCFAGVDEYITKVPSEGFIEFHRKYIDVQIILQGAEKIGICHKDSTSELEFDEEKDFGKLKGKTDFITLRENYFVIFFPHDGHMPQLNEGSIPARVKKMVIKVPVEEKYSD